MAWMLIPIIGIVSVAGWLNPKCGMSCSRSVSSKLNMIILRGFLVSIAIVRRGLVGCPCCSGRENPPPMINGCCLLLGVNEGVCCGVD